MAEDKKMNSHLNKRSKMSDIKADEVKVQTNDLVQPEVKLPCVNYEATTPYSVLAHEFVEINSKTANVPFVVDSTAFVNQEVVLPSVDNKEKVVKAEKQEVEVLNNEKENVLSQEKLPEIPIVESGEKDNKLSELEMLNKMHEAQQELSIKVDGKSLFDAAKDVSLPEITSNEKTETNDYVKLNELQQVEEENSKTEKFKDKIKSTTSELDEMLKQLEDASNDLGLG